MFSLYYLPLARKLGLVKTTEWGIALRESSDRFDTILGKQKKTDFVPIENTEEYWFADPLLFSDNGRTWLFVEAFNRQRCKGEIGFFEIIDGQPTGFKNVIQTPTHMSYPYVFKHQNQYYMIPETGAAGHIALYKARKFPEVWELDTILLDNVKYCDSTVVALNNGEYELISYKQEGTSRLNQKCTLTVFKLDMEKKSLTKLREIPDRHKHNRPAGPMFQHEGKTYRVSQKCDRAYGEAIVVYKVNSDDDKKYINDDVVNCFCGNNIQLVDGGKVVLTHTYSQAGGYEVIDYRCKK